MKKIPLRNVLLQVCICSLVVVILSSCFSQKIVVGTGAPSRPPSEMAANEESIKAWFFLFALIPAQGPIDAAKMSNGASNYTVLYESNFLDGLITSITGGLVSPRTVTVKR
jgi:Bor protein